MPIVIYGAKLNNWSTSRGLPKLKPCAYIYTIVYYINMRRVSGTNFNLGILLTGQAGTKLVPETLRIYIKYTIVYIYICAGFRVLTLIRIRIDQTNSYQVVTRNPAHIYIKMQKQDI